MFFVVQPLLSRSDAFHMNRDWICLTEIKCIPSIVFILSWVAVIKGLVCSMWASFINFSMAAIHTLVNETQATSHRSQWSTVESNETQLLI